MSMLREVYDRLQGEWGGLQNQWSSTRGQWRDSVGDRFEREFWMRWEIEVPRLLKSVDDLEEVLDQALRNTD
jgi:hypothetical protein